MPTRLIWESATTSDTLALLSAEEERHFWRLIVQADDYGRFDARPHVLRARAYAALLDKVSEAKSELFTQGLVKAGLVRLYRHDGKRYGYFVTWEKFQRVRNKRSRFPDPTTIGSESPQVAASGSEMLSESHPIRIPSESESESEPPSLPSVESPPKRVTRRPEPITKDFIDLMVTEWSPKLGGEERTKETIAEALNHKAMDKRKDKRIYLKGWLRREAERYGKEHNNGRATAPVGGFDNSHDKYVQAAKSDPKPLRSTSPPPQ